MFRSKYGGALLAFKLYHFRRRRKDEFSRWDHIERLKYLIIVVLAVSKRTSVRLPRRFKNKYSKLGQYMIRRELIPPRQNHNFKID